jgi:hypothetical protein
MSPIIQRRGPNTETGHLRVAEKRPSTEYLNERVSNPLKQAVEDKKSDTMSFYSYPEQLSTQNFIFLFFVHLLW